MGRIRTIKPEILTDAKAVKLSDMAWRLWVSTWVLADDEGRFPADPMILAGNVFPGRSTKVVEKTLAEVCRAGMISVYVVNGDRYGLISGWKRHQKINRPSPARFPAPCGPLTEDSLNAHGGLTEGSCKDLDLDLDLDLQTQTPTRAESARAFAAAAVAELNSLTGRKFSPTAQGAIEDAAELCQKFSTDQARQVIRAKYLEWHDSDEMAKNLRPSTLLRPVNFRRYAQDLDGELEQVADVISLEFAD